MNFNASVKIGSRLIGAGCPPYIIAEMACAHDGSMEAAKRLIEAADAARADAIQLQLFVPESTVTPHHEAFPVLREIAFSETEWTELFQFAKGFKPHVWVCTYDLPSVSLAVKLQADGIKLNSADLSNPEVIIAVSQSKIPFTIGTGASTLEEIHRGLETAHTNGARDVILMHGVQNFPTDIDHLSISRLNLLRREFQGMPIGYADHTDGNDRFAEVVDLVAIGLGANVVEKHICLDRSAKGLDSQAALEPPEFISYTAGIRKGYRAFASDEKADFTASDLKYRKFQKKSIVAARDLQPGDVLCRQDVTFLRNDTPGLPPAAWDSHVKGRRVVKRIEKHQNVELDLLVD